MKEVFLCQWIPVNLCNRSNVGTSSAIDGERISLGEDRLAWTSVTSGVSVTDSPCDFLRGTDEYSSFPLCALADTVRPATLLEKHRAILMKEAGSISPQI